MARPPPSAEPPPERPAPEAAGPPILTVLAGLPVSSRTLRAGATLLGRSTDVDWQLKHPEISRRHCRFDWAEGGVCTVEDLGSRWSTKINGAALTPEVRAPLHPGDRLSVGPVLIYFGYGPPPAEVTATEREGSHAGSLIRGPQVLIGHHEVDLIPLGERVRFGRQQGEVDVILADAGISRQHALVERTPAGFQVTDLHSRAGSLINGRRFETHQLVIGDQLQLGPFFFRFDGLALERTTGAAGAVVDARALRVAYGARQVLDEVSLHIERGSFVAILGPSGAGKSTLLNALTGLRPANAGTVRYDGVDLYAEFDLLRAWLGFVPQDDIVHRELTVTEALSFSARLRLPGGTPVAELRKLVVQTIERLGLAAHAGARIAKLSGGQRKRVNVAVELLGRPAVLFLDEPTSGLDPSAEFKLMGLLRHLADSGCTVVCTTHLMENVFLADRLFVIDRGHLVFGGDSAGAKAYFGVSKLTQLYDRLEERPAEDWQRDFQQKQEEKGAAPPGAAALEPPALAAAWRLPRPPHGSLAALWVLLQRQWAILRADPKHFLILFGQPLLIAALVVWATDSTSLTLFFAYLATLWFGCSNSAQEIVRELPIYQRERMVGLGRHAYLASKFLLFGLLTALQGAFLYACLWALRWWSYPGALPERGLDGSLLWQGGAVVGIAFAAAGIGLALSALARSALQAVMLVPLVLIPQILFSGLVVTPEEMPPSAFAFTQWMPSYAAETMMDVGAFWHRPVTGDRYLRREKAREHLQFLLRRELKERLPADRAGEARDLAKSAFAMGAVYNRPDLGMWAAFKLAAWTLAGYVAAWWALRRRERAN